MATATIRRMPNYPEVRALRTKAKKSLVEALMVLVALFFLILYHNRLSRIPYLIAVLPFVLWRIWKSGYYHGKSEAKDEFIKQFAFPP